MCLEISPLVTTAPATTTCMWYRIGTSKEHSDIAARNHHSQHASQKSQKSPQSACLPEKVVLCAGVHPTCHGP